MDRSPGPGTGDPGERRPAGQRPPLERPPAERYREAPPDVDERRSRPAVPGWAVAILIALAGAAAIVLLGGVLSLTAGLLLVAGATGWLVGRAMAAERHVGRVSPRTVATAVAVGSVAVGQVGLWLFATSQGGALSIVDYLAQTFGPLAPAQLAVAAIAAWWAAG